MFFRQIVDPKLAQYAYLIGCQQTQEALIIDPERDIDVYLTLAEAEGLRITAVAETHIHADFLSGSREFAERFGTTLYLSDEGGADWKYEWAGKRPYDCHLLRDNDRFKIGNIEVQAVHTPGHTPEHLSFLVTDRGGGASAPIGIATGDFVFVGDLGRPDLLETAAGIEGVMEASARRLYGSLPRFTSLSDFVQVWPGHGAGSACGKALGAVPSSTVGYERCFNTALRAAQAGEDAFVAAILDGQPEPPPYFARMKRLNKHGVRVLGTLPRPRRLTIQELHALAGNTAVAVLDTRIDRSAFMASHFPGSLHVPLTRTFNTVAGSYVNEDTPIYLLVETHQLEEAVRDLARVGLDDVAGYAPLETLERFRQAGGAMDAIQEIDFSDAQVLRGDDDVQVLDVRNLSEYRGGHVPGALNIAHTRLLPRLGELPRDKTLLVHCGTGVRAATATALLARLGFDVRLINDRFTSWKAYGEVAKGEPAPAAS